jgi:hypothetical protein
MCPITLQLMTEPVITADGHIYDKSSIEAYFRLFNKSKKARSPLTNLQLITRALIPALELDFEIKEKAPEIIFNNIITNLGIQYTQIPLILKKKYNEMPLESQLKLTKIDKPKQALFEIKELEDKIKDQ